MKKTPVGLVVFIPQWMSPNSKQVRDFIEQGIAQLGTPQIGSAPVSTPNDLRKLLRQWAKVMDVKPGRVTFREMYRKWGSCSSRGNITLNTALLNVDRRLAEYIIVHELAHLRIFNHSKEFKALLDTVMPDWRARESELDTLINGQMQPD